MSEEREVGKVMRYFAKIGVAAIEASGDFAVGDTLHFKGYTTDFETKVESMQIEGASVEKVTAGDEIGIKVPERARENDIVYKK